MNHEYKLTEEVDFKNISHFAKNTKYLLDEPPMNVDCAGNWFENG